MIYIDYNDRKKLYRYNSRIYRKYKDIKINISNKRYVNSESNKDMVVNGYNLDKEQKKAIISDEINILVIASAGSGKSLTIIGKINYLINKGIKESEVLCISLTNDACNSLKKKLNYNVEVMTFHKLSLKIIGYDKYKICRSNYLDYIVDEYFNSIIREDSNMITKLIGISGKNITYNDYLSTKEYYTLRKTIITFINLFKANGYQLDYFCQLSDNKFNFLLRIIIDIYLLYKQELEAQRMIDFDDMINISTDKVLNDKVSLKYKYIIIDEFQDTSLVKLNLIKAIVQKCGAKTFVVGDDYQSIYKFTGCNLDIFLHYDQYMGYVEKHKIVNTYRNSKQLVAVANKFVLKNKYQIKKKIKSTQSRIKPIKIVKYQKNILELLLDYLVNKKEKNILLLGRNNYDINRYLSDNIKISGDVVTYKNYELNIRYLTVHKAKGLEADCVIVLNLFDDILGFPCQIKNAEILSLISQNDRIKYEEERRLFYVCLTRTKNDIYLICPINLSVFVKEIINENKKHVQYLNL